MSKYKAGKWYKWIGGECPVEPSTIVEVTYITGDGEVSTCKGDADTWEWDYPDGEFFPLAFRILDGPKEPREFWLCADTLQVVTYKEPDEDYIHVREVLE